MRLATVAVIAKEPVAGRVKTRLISDQLSATDTALLAQCCLRDTFTALAELDCEHRVVVLDGAPGPWLPTEWSVQYQSSGLLDERLASGFDALAPGPAVLVGMDTPQVRAAELCVDWRAYDACIGMASDGGFWTIGFADPSRARSVIEGVAMSRADTGAVQLARLRAAGMRVRVLATLTDIDTVESAQLVSELIPASNFGSCWRALNERVA